MQLRWTPYHDEMLRSTYKAAISRSGEFTGLPLPREEDTDDPLIRKAIIEAMKRKLLCK